MGIVFRSNVLALALLSSASVGAAPPEVIEIDTSSLPPVNSVAPATQLQGSSELVMLIEQLQQEVRSLRGELEKQAFQLKSMERQQLDRYRDLDRRISALGTAGVGVAQPAVATSQAPASAETAVTTPPDTSQTQALAPARTPVTTKDGVSDATAYRDAFELVRSRDYTAAVTAFKAFLRDYPGSEREANVHYWLGEIYHAEKKLEDARESFALVLGQYPDHSKAPQAAYKLGVIYHELGDKVRAKEYMDYVLQHYPKSKVAPLAQDFSSK